MTRKVDPIVIDFSQCGHVAKFNTLPHPTSVKGPTTFTVEDGKLKYHTRAVPEWRMKRARRVLWECQQHPDWPHRPSMLFRHPLLKNVPYPVLKQLVKECEVRHGRSNQTS